MKLIPAVCPRCGANVELPDGLEKAHCVYCGTQILFGRASVGKGLRCPLCEGFGRVDRCRACDGTGRCAWSTVSPGSRHDIFAQGYSSHCDNGVCSACGGSGRWNLGGCPGCEGTGRCPKCHGSGKCAACHGVGLLPSPTGSEKCLACDGTGIVDPDKPTDPLAGRCPICKRAWAGPDAAFCSNCGYRRESMTKEASQPSSE